MCPARAAAAAMPLPVALVATRELRHGFEATVFAAPKSLRGELSVTLAGALAPSGPLARELTGLLLVPCCQRARLDLLGMGGAVAAEKDRCLAVFVRWAAGVRARLAAAGRWCDWADPCSGLPAHTPSSAPYPEVDTMEVLLRYRVDAAGACRVLLHPRWAGAVYPATLWSDAPPEELAAAMAAQAEADEAAEAAEAGGGAGGAGSSGDAAAAAACLNERAP